MGRPRQPCSHHRRGCDALCRAKTTTGAVAGPSSAIDASSPSRAVVMMTYQSLAPSSRPVRRAARRDVAVESSVVRVCRCWPPTATAVASDSPDSTLSRLWRSCKIGKHSTVIMYARVHMHEAPIASLTAH